MRIGLSTSVIQRGKSGVGQYVLALARAFLPYAAKHEFTLFVLEEDLDLLRFVEGDMRIYPVPEKYRDPVKDILWHQTKLPALARQFGLSVLHIPSYRRMVWQRPCATVATIHDLAPFHIPNKYDWLRMLYARTAVRWLSHRQDAVIAISQTTARDIHRFFGMTFDSINVVYNGIDHRRFNPGEENRQNAGSHIRELSPTTSPRVLVADRFGLEKPYFIYVSRLEHPGKNHVRLITAFNTFKAATSSDWQLVLAGGDWHGSDVIHGAIRQSPFAADIRALGFVRGDDIPILYRAASACVYPSLFEGFGLPPLEAMACGCPVLSSNRGSLAEVVSDAAVTLDPEDIKAWKQAMLRISTDAELRLSLRSKGFARAELFDWRKTATGTLDVYERAVARARSRQYLSFEPSSESQPIPRSSRIPLPSHRGSG
jgi:glycosyltransferase involved in cell wall biosynthesis